MTLNIHNTISDRLEPFTPLQGNTVRMYVCGVTVYDSSHVGHARAAVAFDVIYRYLLHKGYSVSYIRNFTDVDDKIIHRSQKEHIPCEALTQQYIQEYTEEMQKLNVLRPGHEPKATEHIPEMINVIKKLVENGHAYASGGDVFYDINSFSGYGKLSGKSLEEMKAGARVDVDERKKIPLILSFGRHRNPENQRGPLRGEQDGRDGISNVPP